MGSINIITKYFSILNDYKNINDLIKKNKLVHERDLCYVNYNDFIKNENFMTKLNRLYTIIKNFINYIGFNNNIDPTIIQSLHNELLIYTNTSINNNIKAIYDETCCVCLFKMEADPITSSSICKKCGISNELPGTIFDDDQCYNQDGQRIKHGTYDPAKHCRFWVDRIQARENTEIPEPIIKDIKKCITNDRIKVKEQITCSQIRIYLQKTHNSKYNEHIPLIRKIITGITPVQLTDDELQLIYFYFDMIIHIFDEIKPQGKSNCPYHPYFIYKIIEQILTKETDRIRRYSILSCIHLQSRETLISNDLIWHPICKRIPEFIYIPTDRNQMSIY